MLKWLSGSRPKSPQPEIVTDDPLATIPVHKLDSPLEIYAVSRVNPIFDEGGEVVVVDDGAARGSSGYGSGGSGGGAHSPSESSEDLGHATPAAPAAPPPHAAAAAGVPRPVWPPHQHIDSHDALYAALAKRLVGGGTAEDALRRLTQTPGRALRVGGGGSSTSSSSSSGFCEEPRPPLYGGGSREKLLQPASSPAPVKQQPPPPPPPPTPPTQQLANRCWAGVVPGDVRLQSKDDFYWRPDFTLDRPAAERLLRTIQKAKRRRCWCRLVTCLLGLVVFLLSVMVVSLALSRGQRYFGSL